LLQRDINTARYQGNLDKLQEHLKYQLISPGLVLGGVPGAQRPTGTFRSASDRLTGIGGDMTRPRRPG